MRLILLPLPPLAAVPIDDGDVGVIETSRSARGGNVIQHGRPPISTGSREAVEEEVEAAAAAASRLPASDRAPDDDPVDVSISSPSSSASPSAAANPAGVANQILKS